MNKSAVLCGLILLVLLVSGILVGCVPVVWHAKQAYELNNQGRHDEAIVECNKAIELYPYYAWAFYTRACTYKLQGKKAEAIADFEKFITLSDNPQWVEKAREAIEELSKC